MAQINDYRCDRCNSLVTEVDPPVLVYVVAGCPGGPQELDQASVSPAIARLLSLPVSRLELCVHCAADAIPETSAVHEALTALGAAEIVPPDPLDAPADQP